MKLRIYWLIIDFKVLQIQEVVTLVPHFRTITIAITVIAIITIISIEDSS